MKLVTATMLFFMGFSLFAQNDIQKKANTIIVTDTINRDEFYNKITIILFENGYGIFNTSKEQGIISTSEKSYKNGVIKLNILIRDKQVLIRGDFKSSISINFGGVTSEASWEVIENKGQKNSPYKNAWEEMKKLTDAISGSKEYLIK